MERIRKESGRIEEDVRKLAQPSSSKTLTLVEITKLLENHERVKVGGTDVDGVLRGKVLSKEKFLETLQEGFGTFL